MRRYRGLRNSGFTKARQGRGALDAREKQERKDYADVHARSGGQCEVVLGRRRCPKPRMPGVHHITKRSQGGRFAPTDYLLDICARHHDLADNAAPEQRTLIDGVWVHGRLRMTALGGGKFRFWLETESVKHRAASMARPTTDGAASA